MMTSSCKSPRQGDTVKRKTSASDSHSTKHEIGLLYKFGHKRVAASSATTASARYVRPSRSTTVHQPGAVSSRTIGRVGGTVGLFHGARGTFADHDQAPPVYT